MPLEKLPAATSDNFLVTFSVPCEAEATTAELAGDFTGWTPMPMQPTGDGGHALVVELAGGTAYRFRYFLDGTRWENAWAADDYTANDYGGDDSVVDLTEIASRIPGPDTDMSSTDTAAPSKRKRASRRKTAAAD
jgi:hypothetical protein